MNKLSADILDKRAWFEDVTSGYYFPVDNASPTSVLLDPNRILSVLSGFNCRRRDEHHDAGPIVCDYRHPYNKIMLMCFLISLPCFTWLVACSCMSVFTFSCLPRGWSRIPVDCHSLTTDDRVIPTNNSSSSQLSRNCHELCHILFKWRQFCRNSIVIIYTWEN